jgi:hypothetical protein
VLVAIVSIAAIAANNVTRTMIVVRFILIRLEPVVDVASCRLRRSPVVVHLALRWYSSAVGLLQRRFLFLCSRPKAHHHQVGARAIGGFAIEKHEPAGVERHSVNGIVAAGVDVAGVAGT